jgi:hypothetical protein
MMLELQIESVESPPFASDTTATLALVLLARAQTMGFLPDTGGPTRLDRALLGEIAGSMQRQGIATAATASLGRALSRKSVDDVAVVAALRATLEAVNASPHPAGEWGPARELLGDELLARLVRVSPSSLRRYAGGERRTPDEVAWRLHAVARMLAALAGGYNDYGIRRWFERHRSALEGATPAELVEQSESEDDDRLVRVIALAEELLGPGGAA